MASSFQNLNLHFADVPAFARWLATCPQPQGWTPRKVTYHNTYKPTQATWNGHATMAGLASYYERTNGWDRGPHLFLATDTHADGIFVMTPPWLPGIHAGACNSVAWGIENVGDYQTRPMSEAQVALLVGVSAALLNWQRLPAEIDAHRDCMANRTCPGNAAYAQKSAIQRRLDMMLNTTALTPDRAPGSLLPYTEDSSILGQPRATMKQCADYILAAPTGEYDEYDVEVIILPAYWTICQRAGVDPIIAIAQMCHETGEPSDAPGRARALWSYWSQRPRRNPAGIGVTGTPGAGVSFASWAPDPMHPERVSGIEAHVGRLLAYAVLPAQQTAAQAALVQKALSVRSLPSRYWGVAPTLHGLERKWAPGDNYANRIAEIANAIRGMR